MSKGWQNRPLGPDISSEKRQLFLSKQTDAISVFFTLRVFKGFFHLFLKQHVSLIHFFLTFKMKVLAN